MKALFDRLFGRSSPSIVDAKPADAAALAALHGSGVAHAWSESEFEGLLSDRAVVAHVARAGARGAPVGFLLSRRAADEAEILTVAVAPSARAKGVART